MNRIRPTRIACLTLLACVMLLSNVSQAASPVLIAIGSITGFYQDFATETADPLENKVAGNLLGGLGSALAHMGGDDFVALPDRGPNAVAFNSCTDDTVSYINRFHTFHLSLAPSDPAFTTLPFTLTPMLVDTTLLWSQRPLVYGTGCGAVGNGEPAVDAPDHGHFFTGRSDNFGPGASTDPSSARLDPEGIRVSADRQSVFISDEYGPFVYEFDRDTGRRLRVYTLPAKFAIPFLSAVGNDEIIGNSTGRVTNKGMEGLAITPDGRTLVGAMQSPLIQDGGDVAGGITRIVTINVATGFTREYAYQLDTGGKKTTVSEIVAINDHEFLVDERDSKGLGDDSTAAFKKLFKIDLAGAKDVTGLTGKSNLAPWVVPKVEFLNIVAVLTASGMDPSDIPAKLEGLAFGEDVKIGGVMKHTLYVSNDNDFLGVTKKTVSGVATLVSNPNRFFVFAFSDADLPGFRPQRFFRDGDDERNNNRRDGKDDRR